MSATFQASTAPGLYWLAEPGLPAGYGIGFLPAAAGEPPPPSLTLQASWETTPGLYVMTAVRPAADGEAAFARSVRDWWAWSGASARFAWIADPSGDPSAWAPRAIHLSQGPGDPKGVLTGPAQLAFGAYTVVLATGVQVQLAEDGDGFVLGGSVSPGFTLSTPESVWALTVPPAVGGPATAMPFTGPAAGCVLLDLALPQDLANSGVDDYERLDVGLRTAAEAASVPGFVATGVLDSIRYPVFAGVPTGGASFSGRWDPALPTDATRTRLAFSATPAHGSYYRGPLGDVVTMTPAAGGSLPAGLAFHRRPTSLHPAPGDDPLYLAPIGRYALSVGGQTPRLAAGASGYEYFGLSAATGAIVDFIPAQPAYARGLVTQTAAGADEEGGGSTSSTTPSTGAGAVTLTGLATCPYACVTPSSGASVTYFAQPRDGALHSLRAGGDADLLPYLEFLAVPAGAAGSSPAYPLMPYAGVTSTAGGVVQRMEGQVLAPLRRQALAAVRQPGEVIAPPGTDVQAATPRGLLATFDPTLATWKTLQLVASQTSAPPPLELLALGTDLRAAMLSNQLFMVVADAALLLDETDLNYWVTDAAMDDLRALPPDQRPSEAVLAALSTARDPQAGESAFVTYLNTKLPGGWAAWQPVILQYCAYFELTVEGWRFRLSPTTWGVNADPAAPVLMIFKFASGTLRARAADPGSWTWPQAAEIDGSTEKVAAVLAEVIADADAQVAAATTGIPSPLQPFVERVVDDPSWNGVLVLNAPVPLNELPKELQGLATGIDRTRFRAHHVGVSISPVAVDTTARTLALGNAPVFGLIDYEDPQHIEHTYGDFDFKVLLLQVLFLNSAVAGFASRAELFINRLFGDPVTLLDSDRYNNLVLQGSYQRAQGGGHYVFATTEASRYQGGGQVMESVEVSRAQFNTLAGTGAQVASRFTLWGLLRFRQLDGLDVFSFGPTRATAGVPAVDGWLAYGGLSVDMTFDDSDPAGTRVFVLRTQDMAFDTAGSVARDESLFRRFPLQVAGLVRGEPGTTPADQGYLAVRTPLYQPALNTGWYALAFNLDLGTLGALAADAGLVVSLAAAWGPSESGAMTAAANVGLRLPGVQSIGQLLPIQGILGLGFQALDLNASPAPTGGPSYVLRMRRFYLRLLGWQFPPGQADVYLFGDPDTARQPAGGRRSPVGWYAAYRKKE